MMEDRIPASNTRGENIAAWGLAALIVVAFGGTTLHLAGKMVSAETPARPATNTAATGTVAPPAARP